MALGLALAACENELPTAAEESLLPVDVRTVELRLPFDAFTGDRRVLRGFGGTAAVGFGLVADGFGGFLDARTLVRFADPPTAVTVVDPDTREAVVDSALTFVGGRLVVRLDTADSAIPAEGVHVSAGLPDRIWDRRTATWALAVDSVGESVSWGEPGGGPVTGVGSDSLFPGVTDTLSIALDSASLAPLVDTSAVGPGLRIAAEGPGARLRILSLFLEVEVRPSVDPDTTVTRSVGSGEATFIYDPMPGDPGDRLRIGGAPAWRTILELTLPDEVAPGDPGAPAGLDDVIRIDAERVTFAELVLRTAPVPPAFEALDSLRFGIRPVLAPERLPKSPLGGAVDVPPPPVAPGTLVAENGDEVRFPMTRFVRNFLRGETAAGDPAPTTFALLDRFEPSDIGYGSFRGAGEEGAPVLRIILSEGGGVTLP